MKENTKKILDDLICRYPSLVDNKQDILDAYLLLENAYNSNHKLLVCGNGGSAADSEHIVGELMKCFKKKRAIKPEIDDKLNNLGDEGRILQNTLEGSLEAISLTSHLSLSTAFANDKEPSVVFAQQLYGLGKKNDILLLISTSGNSKNCVLAATLAKAMDIKTIALTGKMESKLSNLCDITIKVPEMETFKIQELHLPIYHCLCAMLEDNFF